MRRSRGLIVLAVAALAGWAIWSGRLTALAHIVDVSALFGQTPHEDYADRLRAAGLDSSPLGRRWLDAANDALNSATPVATPYVEARWFPASVPAAMAFRATARRGQRLVADAALESETPIQLFIDLFEVTDDGVEHAATAHAGESRLTLDVRRDATYLIRIQPELLEDTRITLTWRMEPTLAVPVAGATRGSIQSYFLAPRDGGRREHHGVDIFAPRGTPVVAAASGLVTSVGTNALGGNVVWVARPLTGESHYYAHLDTQTVTAGTHVDAGEELGTVGTTGNARGGPPHLHFGIYAREPIDPLPYLAPAPVIAPIRPDDRLGARARLARTSVLDGATYRPGTIVDVVGVSPGRLRVRLPDGTEGYLSAASVVDATEMRTLRLAQATPLASKPSGGLTVDTVGAPASVAVLGTFEGATLVRAPNGNHGWVQRQ
jgi:peptidoglycan LD-endopeptidase LytH